MKAWLKYGLIGAVIGFLVSFLTLKIPAIYPTPNVFPLFLENLVFWVVPLFIIGAIIGLIISKFKNRKKQNQMVKEK